MAQLFPTPPAVTGYFVGKGDRPAFSWLDVWGEEHAHAFTVAKAVDAELLGTFRRSISTAIAEGKTFERWRDEVQVELQRLGWWGARRVADPTGEDPDALVDFSAPRRLQTIFWSNMRAARAAGQWERIQGAKRGLPFLLYVRSAASEPRREHLGWVGIILPIDHPWWSTHFPPNGWGCKCSVRQISGRERDRLLNAERRDDAIVYVTEPPDDGPPREFRNRRTGELTRVPAGIDPGWHTNPGLARSRRTIVSEDLGSAIEEMAEAEAAAPDATESPARIGAAARIQHAQALVDGPAVSRILDLAAGHDFQARDQASIGRGRAVAPIGLLSRASVERTGAPSRQILLSVATAAKQRTRHSDVTAADYAKVQALVEANEPVNSRENRIEVAAFLEDEPWYAVLKIVPAAAEIFLTTLHRLSPRQVRQLGLKRDRKGGGEPGGS